jgi:hypothetical protein
LTEYLEVLKTRVKQTLVRWPVVQMALRRRNTLLRVANVAMLHPGRCGSTVVAKMLDDHPDIHWPGEIFERMDRRYPKGTSARSIISNSMYSSRSPFYGFETKYLTGQHLSEGAVDLSLEEYVALLREMRFTKFIVLRRANHLRKAVSAEIGRRDRRWHVRKERGKPDKVLLDLERFRIGSMSAPLLEVFRQIDERYDHLQRLLRSDEVLNLSYEEDILGDPTVAYRKACHFMGVTPASPEVRLTRTNPFPPEELIENFAEVTAALSGTKYEWMLTS